MIQEPEKPKNYYRDYAIIVLLAILAGFVLILLELRYFVVLVPVAISVIVPMYWFREYEAKVREFHASEAKTAATHSENDGRDINENILKYVKAQRIKRANAKWWEFWV